MTPSPEQIAELNWDAANTLVAQSTEIVELKAKLAGAEAEIAALKQGLRRADEKLEVIEDEISMERNAWDLAHHKELIAAAVNAWGAKKSTHKEVFHA